MQRATHLAALRMASKVALSASVLACSAATTTPIGATPPSETTATTSAPPPEKASCESVINQAFPTEGQYPGTKKDVSPEVVACCRESLLKHQGSAPHRWDCCAQFDKSTSNEIHAACTPWGPPTPPAMVAEALVRQGVLDLREPARAVALSLPRIPSLEASAIATWRGRMVNEYASSRVFAALAQQLAAAGIAAREVSAFACEERRHGVLCGAVVESLGGEARAELPDAPPYPLHPDAHTPLEAALRNVLSICCLSETVAVALIGAERLEMPAGELRDLLTTIWADEVGHARFGWRCLAEIAPSLDASSRARLGDYLEVAFAHLVEHELAHLPVSPGPPAEGVAYGLCDGGDARALFIDTVETVIVPVLEAHGLAGQLAWERATLHHQERRRTRIGMPPFGRSVTSGSGCTRAPDGSSSRTLRA